MDELLQELPRRPASATEQKNDVPQKKMNLDFDAPLCFAAKRT